MSVNLQGLVSDLEYSGLSVEEFCTCPHDETDHWICLCCGRDVDMNSHNYISDEAVAEYFNYEPIPNQ